jgi:YesN/AraC family two-component response regulator
MQNRTIAEAGKILIADDEETFLQSTADLLRKEGYFCDCVPDAKSGIEKLKDNEYDLLIADIKMPGNPGLELINDLHKLAEGMSAILVTGYPSQTSAIKAVQLPVTAYLVKPLNFKELLEQVKKAVVKTRVYRAVVNARERLQYWRQGLDNLEEVLKSSPNLFSASVREFIDITCANINSALYDIKNISFQTASESADSPVCHLLNCPRLAELDNAVYETIEVLEKTKTAFKSKELGKIRKKLEDMVEKRRKVDKNG